VGLRSKRSLWDTFVAATNMPPDVRYASPSRDATNQAQTFQTSLETMGPIGYVTTRQTHIGHSARWFYNGRSMMNCEPLPTSLATLMRPAGGWLADRIGGAQVLSWVFGGVALFSLLLTWPSMVPFTVGALGCAMLMGLGNGAVFKLVPEHFPKDTGTVTGLVGAFGGLGGFFPPLLLGIFHDRLGVIWPGSAACVASGPWHDSQAMPLCRAWARRSTTSEWHSAQAACPACAIGRARTSSMALAR